MSNVEYAIGAIRAKARAEAVSELSSEIRARFFPDYNDNATEDFVKGVETMTARVETVLTEWEKR